MLKSQEKAEVDQALAQVFLDHQVKLIPKKIFKNLQFEDVILMQFSELCGKLLSGKTVAVLPYLLHVNSKLSITN